MNIKLNIDTPRWAVPLLEPKRYKGAKGGRSSGKSHFFAELALEEMVADPNLRFVCIREVQRTLRYSAKALIESKIRKHGLETLFDITDREIRSKVGSGVMIFEGMQDHTADSIKSLEGFARCWVEEAQSLSRRSLELLLPTIRAAGSEIWFSWNPEQPDDPVDKFFADLAADDPQGKSHTQLHVNYLANPFVEAESVADAERMRRTDSDAYEHVWLGGYNLKSDAKVLAGKYVIEAFEVPHAEHVTRKGDRVQKPIWDGPYFGADHGFAMDPRTLIKCWIGPHHLWGERCLYVERESYHVKLGIDKAASKWEEDIPGCTNYVIRADSSEPGTIDYLKRHGVPKIEGVKKWQGSVEDGVAFLRSFDKIIIHEECPHTAEESRLYSYKVDKHTGEIKPDIEDRHNHCIDGERYALAPLIKPGPQARWRSG